MIQRIAFLLLSELLCQAAISQKQTESDFSAVFASHGVEGCFVLYNPSYNEFIRYNPGLCDSGYIPASTFKIPNSVIALEEGVVKDSNQVFIWDGHEWPSNEWNRDQTLKTAIKYSCVWVFMDIAEQIGIDTYYRYINEFDYGNKDLTGPPTRFWLAGSFRISANRQVEFLRKFYFNELPVSQRSTDIVKDLIVLEQTPSYTLSGKTGGGILNDKEYIMWLVGYIEKDKKTYFYAMNFKTNNFEASRDARFAITKYILRELGLLE
jgi:beta-lactamase class D